MLASRLISTNKKVHSGLAIAIAALSIAISPNVYAQSPLTVQPSTGRVGVGNTNPAETLDVTGNIKNSGTLDVTGNIKNNGSLSVGTTAQTGTANRFRYLNSIVVAGTSASQIGIPVGTWTTVNMGTESVDTDGIHSTSVNSSRLTFPLVGKWLVGGTLFFNYSGITTPGLVGVRIIKNGSTTASYGKNLSSAFSAAGDVTSVVSTGLALIVAASITDYVELQAIVTGAGGTFDVPTNTDNQVVAFYIGE